MGKFSDLTDVEKRVLGDLAEPHADGAATTWYLLPLAYGDTSTIIHALDGTGKVGDAPFSPAFYRGLEQKGYLVLDETVSDADSLQFTIQQRTLEYGIYASRKAIRRWLIDFSHDLTHEKTLWARLMWLLVGYLLGLLTVYLSKILG